MLGVELVTVKLADEVTEPSGVVKAIFPVVAPAGTMAVTCVALFTVKDVAAVLLNVTAVAPVRFVPVIVTEVPTAPLAGLKLLIVGVGTETVKLALEVALPFGVVTVTLPVVAPVGTVVVICVALATVKDAEVPLNASAVAPVRFVPVMVTAAPTAPLAGVKLLIVGAVEGGGAVVEPVPPPQAAATSNNPSATSPCSTENTPKCREAVAEPARHGSFASIRGNGILCMWDIVRTIVLALAGLCKHPRY
jgi:hypothetical protein